MIKSVEIKDFPNYSITETGIVYSHNYRNSGKTKKLSLSKKDGYFIVGLSSSRDLRIHHKVNWNKASPKIIRQEYKK